MMIRTLFFSLALIAIGACATPYVQPAGVTQAEPAILGQEGRVSVTVSDGARLPLQVWEAASATAVVLGVHGFNDYSSTFDAAGRWWAAQGITTYAYDQRGFGAAPEPGTWPGTERLVQDLEDVVAAVRALHPGTPIYLHGNSMGGAVVLVALARRPGNGPLAEVAGASLTAPAVWGGTAMSPFYRASLWIAAHTIPSRHVTGRGFGILPSDNIEMLRALGRDPLVIKETRVDAVYGLVRLMGEGQSAAGEVDMPLLVLYGAKDRIIPRRPTASMAARMNGASRFAVYPKGYHMLLRDLQAETVWRDIASWITDRRAPLPSGAEVAPNALFAHVN